MIPVLLWAIMGDGHNIDGGQSPATRLYKLTKGKDGDLNRLAWREELRYIPKLIKIQRKSLIIIGIVIFTVMWFILYDVDNGAKFLSKIFVV